jgi:uncharacterized membrane protein YdjX (TVP38/TMEM64 family)
MIRRESVRRNRSEPPPAHVDPSEHTMPPGSNRNWILALVVITCIAVIFLVGWHWWADWHRLWDSALLIFASPSAFHAWIDQFGAWAPLLFFLGTAAQVIVAPIPGSVFPPVAAAAFGPLLGLALLIAGTAAGSIIVFALARVWGRPLAARIVGVESLDRYTQLASAQGGLWLFCVYLLPLLPDDVVTAAAGLSRISFPRFLLLSTVGRLPGMVASVYAAELLFAGPLWIWLVVGAVAVGAALLAYRYRSKWENWLVSRAGRSGNVPRSSGEPTRQS